MCLWFLLTIYSQEGFGSVNYTEAVCVCDSNRGRERERADGSFTVTMETPGGATTWSDLKVERSVVTWTSLCSCPLQVKLDVYLAELTKIGKSQKYTLSVDVEGGRLVVMKKVKDSQEDWTTFTHDKSENPTHALHRQQTHCCEMSNQCFPQEISEQK